MGYVATIPHISPDIMTRKYPDGLNDEIFPVENEMSNSIYSSWICQGERKYAPIGKITLVNFQYPKADGALH